MGLLTGWSVKLATSVVPMVSTEPCVTPVEKVCTALVLS